ncbi:MAG TPA: polysaccharide biosynthesis tyrosine autokinase [Gemmatimonadales bacterium]|nr:polysaccharide biosynthesis tyrosine autokinase [Gemmatimonadales bacterium]
MPRGRPNEEEVVSFGLVAGMARRRWLLILLCVVVSIGVAMSYLMLTPPSYESGASLLVEGEQYDLPEVTKRLNDQSDVNTQLEVLKSATLAERVVRDLALRVTVKAYAGPSLVVANSAVGKLLPSIPQPVARSHLLSAVAVSDSADTTTVTLQRLSTGAFQVTDSRNPRVADTVAVGKKASVSGVAFTLAPGAADFSRIKLFVGDLPGALDGLRQDVRLSRADRDVDVLWIRYRTPDPLLASQVPNLWAQHYLDMKVGAAKAKISNAIGFLRGQADTLQSQLMASEEALRDYRQKQGIVDLNAEALSQVEQGAQVDTKRMLLEAERTALRRLVSDADTANKGSSAPSPYRRLAGFPTLIANQTVSDQLHTLSELEQQRSEMLERRTAQDPDVMALSRRINDVDAQLRGLTNAYLEGLNNQLSSLEGSIRTNQGRMARIPAKAMNEDRLSRKPKLLGDVYSMVQTRLQEARIAESAADPGVRLVDRAEIPTLPVWPRANLILLVAIAVGVMAGGTFAWLREGMDGSVHSRADVIRAANLPLLGLIPRIRMLRPKKMKRGDPIGILTATPRGFGSRARRSDHSGRALLLGGKDKSGAALEAYAWLETSLALTRPNDAPRTVAFTSPLSREGKTINAANLALSVARRGRKVLLIDADLRRGMIHHLFGISQDRGLADVLARQVTLEQAIRVLPLGEGTEVHVMPCGQSEAHPAAALRSDDMKQLLHHMSSRYDLILVDSPPVNLVSDPLVIATMVDGVILVARAGVTESDALAEASQHLREAGAPVLGVLLNDIDLKRDSSYDEAYRYLDEAGDYSRAVPA